MAKLLAINTVTVPLPMKYRGIHELLVSGVIAIKTIERGIHHAANRSHELKIFLSKNKRIDRITTNIVEKNSNGSPTPETVESKHPSIVLNTYFL